MTQTLTEHVVVSSLWKMLRSSSDVAHMTARLYGVPTDWLAANRGDRGAPGRDLVDFLDGTLCLHGQEDRALIREVVVNQHRFPYDMSPSCKPGTTCNPRQYIDPPAVPLPGRLVTAPDGVLLREIPLPVSSSTVPDPSASAGATLRVP